ncbi:oxidoreductase [Serinicoccus sp. CNJ-927]|uniref:OsmC family protein n=1 Tax=Serinicoccus TaxID=265976 RepID=UPI0003B6FA91|nr:MULTISPECIES: OsmC family protein [Serinicoccus]OLT15953.1 oxidoreductase [Serinicoccus sp. CUA-874]OLT39417.1 oxidoreductase [Serinicoccus sp. CNJ-927]
MADDPHRSVSLTRTGPGHFEARNARGGSIPVGDGAGEDGTAFTPVELLLAGIAGCSGIDIDLLTSRKARPDSFEISAGADKVRDEDGNHLGPVTVTVQVTFPEGEDGDAARERLPEAVAMSRDRLCTVSRTVALPTPVDFDLR